MTEVLAVISAVLGGGSLVTLITFLVTRHDTNKGIAEQTQKNTNEINEIKNTLEILKAMCLGSLYDRCKFLGEQYIKRGYITSDEYDDWIKYLYDPYKAGEGDGTIDKIKLEIDKLPFRK